MIDRQKGLKTSAYYYIFTQINKVLGMKMVKYFSLAMVFFLSVSHCYGQKTTNPEKVQIKNTVVGFLKWYKIKLADTAHETYRITKGGYPDTTTNVRIDQEGIERYLKILNRSQLLSETYINDLRSYFMDIDKMLANLPNSHESVKVPGLDIDFVLHTFEPEMILDHIKDARFDKIEIIYDKAIAHVIISKTVEMIFTLTRKQNRWLIDYTGYDAGHKYSIATQ